MPVSNEYAQRTYRKIQHQYLSPRRALLLTYSEIISACFNKDLSTASRGLMALKLSLNSMQYPEITAHLHGILEYCQSLALKGDFIPIANTLIALRDSLLSNEEIHTN